ncbi:CidA/LrgA family protein [Neobacillus sp. D3-1R]|uniref:CidA/LrgA family protein n=1 Tax=Neobacillus sp. D3-1R TaxID=3445778 RepID=UPI003F9F436E
MSKVYKWGKLILQIATLCIINEIGYFFVHVLNLPIPGNVLGMIILLVLLASGVIKLKWIEEGSNLLIKYLAFFFIPISVGLINFGPLFLKSGFVIAIVLIGSAITGILITGSTSGFLASRKKDDDHETHIHYGA